jgi:hypothetical protein
VPSLPALSKGARATDLVRGRKGKATRGRKDEIQKKAWQGERQGVESRRSFPSALKAKPTFLKRESSHTSSRVRFCMYGEGVREEGFQEALSYRLKPSSSCKKTELGFQ